MKHTVVAAALCLLVASNAWPQAGTGVIEGTVMDGRGQPAGGVTVTARHIATDTPYRIRTNDLGVFRFTTVPPGTYEILAPAPAGTGTAILVVKVVAGAAVTANIDASTPLATIKQLNAGKAPKLMPFEVAFRLGWTLSDGVSLGRVEASDGRIFNSIDPLDALSWGFTLGYFLTPKLELELLYARQGTTLQANGPTVVDIGDVSITNYHGIAMYHFGSAASPVRLYAFGGVGATAYGTLTFTPADGQSREIGGRNRWSSTVGGGVKVYRKQVGARVEARYTPTYIKSQATGWWCDAYWGCYTSEKSQFSNQLELSGGVTVRF